MKMNNRMNIENIIKIFGMAVSIVCILGCAGFNKTHPQEGSYLVSGKISLAAESGAMPSQLQNLLNTSARTATSTFAQTTNEIARDFTVTATHTIAETGEVITKTCVIETSEDGSRTYSLRLPYTGSWTLEARLFGYIDDSTTDSIAYLDGQATINITEEASSLIKNIIVSPVFNSNTQGKVNLPVIDETESVNQIKIFEYETDLDGKEVMAATPSLDTTFINSLDYIQGDYEPGSHKIAIYFYNSESETQEIYSCTEAFVVYSGFVTDIWYGQAPHLRYNDETRHYDFVITDELLRDYVKRGDLTTKKYEDGYLDTPYILWSEITDERGSSSDFTQTIEGGTSYLTGVQVVGSLNEETTINNPFSSSDNKPCFCFGDDGYLYVLESASYVDNSVINCYKESYSGYVSAKKIDLEEKFFSDYDSHTFGSALLYKDGYLFFIFSNRNSNYNLTYNLCILDLASETLYAKAVIPSLESVSGSLNSSAGIAVKWENADDESNPNLIKKGVLYYSTSDSNEYIENEIISQPFTISFNSTNNSYELQMDSTTAFSYSLSKGNLGVESVAYRFLVSDMQIQDNVLYVLINAYTEKGSTLYTKIDDDNYSEHTIYTSNGGVLRFELSDSDSNSTSTSAFVPSLWGDEEDSPLVLGLYTNNEMYYTYSYNGYTASNLDGDNLRPFVTTPPLSEAESYFYGPQKFIAIKPKELVIADDGAYFDESKIYCKNRVVKVNLGEEALGQMNVTDVNVTFTKKLGSCGGIILD